MYTVYYVYICIYDAFNITSTRAVADKRATCFIFFKRFIILNYYYIVSFSPRGIVLTLACALAHTHTHTHTRCMKRGRRRSFRRVKYRMSLAQSAINLPPKNIYHGLYLYVGTYFIVYSVHIRIIGILWRTMNETVLVCVCVCVCVPASTGSRRVVTAAQSVIILIFYKNIFYY